MCIAFVVELMDLPLKSKYKAYRLPRMVGKQGPGGASAVMGTLVSCGPGYPKERDGGRRTFLV